MQQLLVPKFSNFLLHWTASDLEGGWQKVIQDALEPVVQVGLISIHLGNERLTIVADGQNLEFHVRNRRARGSIEKTRSAWLLSLCLVKLSRQLKMTVVDDEGTAVDRRSLNSKLTSLDVEVWEFDDVSEKLGLTVSKQFVAANPMLANFF